MMPELPEVETVRRGLLPLEGERVSSVVARDPDLFREPLTPEGLEQRLRGETIERFDRRGKFLLIRFGSGTLVISVRMTGHLTWSESNPRSKDRLGFRLDFDDHERSLYFTTVRRLSRLEWFGDGEPEPDSLQRLGPDPLNRESFGIELIREDLSNRRGPIKSLLMDQSLIAGVGNIYASELCYRSRIDPRHRVHRLPSEQLGCLIDRIPPMLHKAVEIGGSSFTHFRDSRGKPGRFHLFHRVYDREGKLCLRCGTEIVKITLSGRSTYFCPNCQNRGGGPES